MGKKLSKLIFTIVTGVVCSTDTFLISEIIKSNSPEAAVAMAMREDKNTFKTTVLPIESVKMTTPTGEVSQNTPEVPEESKNYADQVDAKPVWTETNSAETNPVVSENPVLVATPTEPTSPTKIAEAPDGVSITVAGKTLSIEESDSMADESGDHVLRYQKLLRGHNSEEVFRVLYKMGACSASNNCTFSISENGTTRDYQIAERVEYTVEDYNRGKLSSAAGDISMYNLATKAKGHDYALFTCFGEYDAAIGRYRQVLVLYADAI